MNKVLAALVIGIVLSVVANADENNKDDMVTITVPKSSLTPQQKEVTQQENIKSWVGVGKEIGDAVNTSLAAVTTQSNNFAMTPVGKLTAFVVIWKVVGRDATGFVVGTVFAITSFAVWIWSYRRMCIPRSLLTKTTTDPTTKQKIREYKVINNPETMNSGDKENLVGWTVGHWAGAILLVIVSLCIIL